MMMLNVDCSPVEKQVRDTVTHGVALHTASLSVLFAQQINLTIIFAFVAGSVLRLLFHVNQ